MDRRRTICGGLAISPPLRIGDCVADWVRGARNGCVVDGSWQTQWRATVAARAAQPALPQRTVLTTAVRCRTGEPSCSTATAGRPGGRRRAACASGLPYRIGDRPYIDGGYRRNENADLAAGYGRVWLTAWADSGLAAECACSPAQAATNSRPAAQVRLRPSGTAPAPARIRLPIGILVASVAAVDVSVVPDPVGRPWHSWRRRRPPGRPAVAVDTTGHRYGIDRRW